MIALKEVIDGITDQLQTNIYITQGDTLILNVSPLNNDGTKYTAESGDVFKFALKEKYTDENPIIKKIIPNETLTLRVDADEMKQLKPTACGYVYEFELTDVNGVVCTFMTGKLFVINGVD